MLDPACGSGNFLYIALRELLNLQKAVIEFAAALGASRFFPSVTPAQLHGIEINEMAHQLAQTAIQIGYIQWLRDNGYGIPPEPILKPLDNIINMDAILAFDAEGKAYEPEWPAADVIIGNPPFLGSYKLRQQLGDEYVDKLFVHYSGKVPAPSDLVCYWFELARQQLEKKSNIRVGLLATNSIKNGASRKALERIKQTGDIFFAYSDRPWILDGAAVRVSLIGFDNGSEIAKTLDGRTVEKINSDLTYLVDVNVAKLLVENRDLVFKGMMKGGPFDIDQETAKIMLNTPLNPNGRPNSDVVKPRLGAQDIVKQNSFSWVIDFGVGTSLEEASLYELPFEYVVKNVKPVKEKNRREARASKWWLFGEPNPKLRNAIRDLSRCIVTPETSKHRVFIWMLTSVIPDYGVHVIARDDYYFFGVLHSKIHELWSLRVGSRLTDRPKYNSSRIFDTFPFPWAPGHEAQDDPRVAAIAAAAKDLVEKRDRWLNAEGLIDAERKKRTLTNLYNARPTWLALAHEKLDKAVFAAYGWPADLSDEQILERLLALNLERAAQQG